MKKKILALCLVLVLGATAIIGGTLAYFTDTEEATNVFTVGNVDVTLIESYLHRDPSTNDQWDNNVPDEDFVRNGAVTDEQIKAASDYEGTAYSDYLAAQQLMPGIEINKMPYVLNEGESAAYVRIRVMFPAELNKLLGDSVFCTTATEEEFTADLSGKAFNVDGVDYVAAIFTRNEALEPDEMTYWNVWNSIRMDEEVTNEDLAWAYENGLAQDGTFGVKVEVDAIQAASFDTAAEAFAAFDAQTQNAVSTADYTADYEVAFPQA